MKKSFLRICSLIIALSMIVNISPLNAQSLESNKESNDNVPSLPDSGTPSTLDINKENTSVLGEIIDKRTEYTKVFAMSNGLHMAAVYDNAVHYRKNGQWLEIDNTLKLSKQLSDSNAGGVYINTAGTWQVSFPQYLSEESDVTISYNGYTLRFRMAGALNITEVNDEILLAGSETEVTETTAYQAVNDSIALDPERPVESSEQEIDASKVSTELDIMFDFIKLISAESSLSLSQPVDKVEAQVEDVDYKGFISEDEYEETVVEKNYSKLQYSDVYCNTDLVYELNSNYLKECVCQLETA